MSGSDELARRRVYAGEPVDERYRRRLHQTDTGAALYTIAFGLFAFALIGAFSLRQISDQENANDTLRPLIAVITDIDAYIAETLPTIRRLAEVDSDEGVPLPGYPLPVTLTTEEAEEATAAEIREIILDRSVPLVYADGASAFDRTGEQSVGAVSDDGMITFALDLLTQSMYDNANLATLIALAVVLLALLMVLLRNHGLGRIRAVGAGLLGAGLFGLGAALLLGWGIDRVWSGDPFEDEIGRILGGMADVPLRNYAIAAGLGLALVVAAFVLRLAERRIESKASRADEHDYGAYEYDAAEDDDGATSERSA